MSYVSHADLGGQIGHGAVVPEPDDALFHASWEPRVLAMTIAMGATGSWNIDMSRAARETLKNYAELSYYQIWFYALEKLLTQHGLVHADELERGKMLHAPQSIARILEANKVAAVLGKGSPTARVPKSAARFTVGQRVRTRRGEVPHHTRLPGYIRGKQGIVERVHGAHVFPDANSQGLGECPQWLYTVVFEEREVWGAQAPPQRLSLAVDAWESYLEPL